MEPRSCGHRQFRRSGRTRARRAAWPLRQGRLRLMFGFPKVSGYLGTSWGVQPGVRGRAVCGRYLGMQYTQARQGRWEGQDMGKAGSRTVLVVYRTLTSYVGFGVHLIEFATTRSFTHTIAHTLTSWPFFYPLTPPSFFWVTLPGLPCFTQPAPHLQCSCRCPNPLFAFLLSLACHGSAHLKSTPPKVAHSPSLRPHGALGK